MSRHFNIPDAVTTVCPNLNVGKVSDFTVTAWSFQVQFPKQGGALQGFYKAYVLVTLLSPQKQLQRTHITKRSDT